jgi:hypothetical protein
MFDDNEPQGGRYVGPGKYIGFGSFHGKYRLDRQSRVFPLLHADERKGEGGTHVQDNMVLCKFRI